MTVGCVHDDGVAQYARGEFLDERRNCVRLSLICLLDLSRRLPDHLVEHGSAGIESGDSHGAVRLYGRCARGERLVGHVTQGHWKTVTFVATLRRWAMRAPQTIDGSRSERNGLCRTVSRSDAQTQAYSDDRQPSGAQGHR